MSATTPSRNDTMVRPYGDTLNDGAVQLSFTLPVPAGDEALEAARRLVLAMGFEDCEVVHDQDLGQGYTFFVVYGHTSAFVDFSSITVPKADSQAYNRETCDRLVTERLGRPVVVVGACTGNDAHTVGIDAILNMKGYHGHYGLERYRMFEVHNLGSQVQNEALIRFAIDHKADAILISQVVTQKETHVHNLTEFIELAESYGIRDRMLLVVGGPRINHQLALELGFDAGFGRKSYAEDVASFIVDKLPERLGKG